MTGASAGIGLAVAEALAAEGASVALVGRTAARLERACERVRSVAGPGARVVPLELDLTVPGSGTPAAALPAMDCKTPLNRTSPA